jgi:hypothetical protein
MGKEKFMGTELIPSGRNISFAPESDGRPLANYLYKQSDTTNPTFRYGKRIMTFDGRVFKYGQAKTALVAGYGAACYFPVSKHITYAVLPVAITAGDIFATVTYPSSCGYASTGFAKDELVGGYIVVGHNTALTTETRVIIGNDAIGATTATAKIYVDGAFQQTNSTSNGAEVYPNPYAYLGKGSLDYNAFMGVPAINLASGYNGFIQTAGPCWCVPGGADSAFGSSADDRTAYFVGDGSVNSSKALTIANGYQRAGFIIDTTSSSVTAMPLIMLQISQ